MSSRCVKFRPESAKGRSRELRKAEAIHHRSRSREGVPAKLESLGLWSAKGVKRAVVRRCKGCRVATLFCPPVEEPRREAGPAAMGHPPWGSKHGLYVVVVNAGGAPKKSLNLVVTWLSGEGWLRPLFYRCQLTIWVYSHRRPDRTF